MGQTERPRDDSLLRFDTTEYESPSIAIVMAVAKQAGVLPTDLEPLQCAVDTDALDSLVSPSRGNPSLVNCSIVFEYSGFQIQVHATGWGHLFELHE